MSSRRGHPVVTRPGWVPVASLELRGIRPTKAGPPPRPKRPPQKQDPPQPPAKSATQMSCQIRALMPRICHVKFAICFNTLSLGSSLASDEAPGETLAEAVDDSQKYA